MILFLMLQVMEHTQDALLLQAEVVAVFMLHSNLELLAALVVALVVALTQIMQAVLEL
jgi:hypothetical protein